MSFKVNLQDKMRIGCLTEQSQVNLVHLPWASDPRQAQNKIIISGIDLGEGLNQGPNSVLYRAPSPQPQATHPTFIQAFLYLSGFSL